MTENTSQPIEHEVENTFAVVAVPEHLHQQVIDYLEELERDSDVSGYMLRIGSPIASGLSAKAPTGCNFVFTMKGDDMDIKCSD